MTSILSEPSLRMQILNKYKKRCAYCGVKLEINNFSIDHIHPKRRGDSDKYLFDNGITRGYDHAENFNPSCKSCNSCKATLSVEQFREELSKKFNRQLRDSSQFGILLRFGVIKRASKNIVFHFERF